MDIDAEGADLPVSLTISNIDINGFNNLSFSGFFAEDDDGSNEDWDLSDYVHIFYSIDGGAEQNLLWFESIPDGSPFNSVPAQDTDFDGDGDGDILTDEFQQFSAAIAGTGSSLTIRIEFDLDSGDEDIALDELVVTGDAAPTGGPECADAAWINEFHYDNAGGDVGEFVEVVLAPGLTPADYDLVFYNGSNGSEYRTENLGSATATTDATSGFQILLVNLPSNGIQNGSPDGIALVNTGTVVEFISYEGTLTATDGPANGMTSTDIGVSETSSTPIGQSLQKTGTGNVSSDFTFQSPMTETPGALNTSQTINTCGSAPTCSINNVTITNLACGDAPNDDDAFFDISFDVSGGSGTQYNILNPDNSTAYSVITSGTTDGTVVGSGNASAAATEGSMAQVIVVDADNAGCMSNPVTINVPVCPDPCPSTAEVFISEFHYDNAGSDVNEFVEVAVADSYTGALSDLSVVLYNGSNGTSYDTKTLDQFTPGATAGGVTYYSFTYPTNGIQNGGPDGIALACGGAAFQFISYEGTFTASNGPAAGMSSTDIGINEPGSTAVGSSLEFFNWAWVLVCQNTKGSQNQGITECCDLEIVSVDATTACPGEGGDITINASCTSCDGILYSIDGGATFQASNTFTDQPISTYQIVVQDAADSSCEDMTFSMVSGPDGSVPAPWMTTDVGSSGTAGNAYAFDECNSQFTVSGGGNNAFPGTDADAVAFINQELCGNGAITAKMESVTPNGYGGLMMRETNSASAKQASIFSNLSNVLRHEARYTTGGNKVAQSHYRPFPIWLKLVRQGDWFFAYYSTTGANFQYIHAVYVPMNSCIQVGLASFSYLPGQQCEAVFSNVSVASSATAFQVSADTGKPASTQSAASPAVRDVQAPSNNTLGQFSVFPNPVSNELNVSFEEATAKEATIRILSMDGRSIYENVHGIQGATVNLPLSQLNMTEGMYLLQVATGEEVRTERFIKASR
ncbi:MAG: T9SS type A sorting domain-containing protein [Bacteroidetes bacterium]|nr:T9SS type A sorting domain-containing protein [Bacteroidota bacterium]